LKIFGLLHVYFWLSWLLVGGKQDTPNYYQLDCRLYNEAGALVAAYPGFTCAFASNGEWLGLDLHELHLYDSRNNRKFTFPQWAHHEVRFSRDETKIYFLSSVIQKWKTYDTRFDVINVADRNGNLIASWSLADHKEEIIPLFHQEILLPAMPFQMDRNTYPVPATHEFSHLNAISEIPPNALEIFLPYMKRGNLLVTFNGLGRLVIFDPALKKIEHIFDNDFLELENYGFHDAQILPNGHLTVYKNINLEEEEDTSFTTLNEYDVFLKKKVWTFRLNPPQFGLNKINGTFQVLPDDNIVISDNSRGGSVVEMTRSGQIVFQKFNDRQDNETGLPVMIYRAKKVAADKFLVNNILGEVLK